MGRHAAETSHTAQGPALDPWGALRRQSRGTISLEGGKQLRRCPAHQDDRPPACLTSRLVPPRPAQGSDGMAPLLRPRLQHCRAEQASPGELGVQPTARCLAFASPHCPRTPDPPDPLAAATRSGRTWPISPQAQSAAVAHRHPSKQALGLVTTPLRHQLNAENLRLARSTLHGD